MNIPDAEKIYYLLTDAKNPVSHAFISNKEMRDLAEYLVENGVRVGEKYENILR